MPQDLTSVWAQYTLRIRGFETRLEDGLVTEHLLTFCDEVFLNVRSDNPPALQAYGRLGFMEHVRFEERLVHRLGPPWSTRLTDQLMEVVDPRSLFEEVLPERGRLLAVPLAVVRDAYRIAFEWARCRTFEVDPVFIKTAAVAGTFEFLLGLEPVGRATQVGANRRQRVEAGGLAHDPDAVGGLEALIDGADGDSFFMIEPETKLPFATLITRDNDLRTMGIKQSARKYLAIWTRGKDGQWRIADRVHRPLWQFDNPAVASAIDRSTDRVCSAALASASRGSGACAVASGRSPLAFGGSRWRCPFCS